MDSHKEQLSQLQDLLLLQRVAQQINSILDLDILLEQIVEDVAETFGYSRSAVLLIDETTSEVVIAAVRGWTTNYHTKGDRFKIGEGLSGHVAQTGQLHYAPDVMKDPHYMVCEVSTRSEVDIPLRSRGKLIGVFNAQHPDVDAFPVHRLQLLEALAGHISVAIENARSFERERFEKNRMVHELDEARVIQTRLYPNQAPDIPHFRLSGFSKPCLAVGGDWYDYIPLTAGQIGIVLGDVAGKGTGAALLMTSTRSILRMYADMGEPPGVVLAEVNRVLMADLPHAKFVTMIYGVLNPARRTLRFANAGHHPPLYISSSGVRILKTRPTLPLGIMNKDYPEHELNLDPGDRLFLYSDGVVEARSPQEEEYGEARLLQHTGIPTSTPESLLKDIQAHTNGHPAIDDITAVMLEAE